MGHTTLVGFDIAAGSRVIEALESAGYKIPVAMWAVLSEYGDARLVIASPSFDQESGLNANVQLFTILGKLGANFSQLPTTMILKMKDPFIRDLRKIFAKAKDLTGMRLGGQFFGDRFIDEGYVYRIR